MNDEEGNLKKDGLGADHSDQKPSEDSNLPQKSKDELKLERLRAEIEQADGGKKKSEKKEKKTLFLPLLLSSIFLCCTFCVFGPLDLYYANTDELWFTLKDIWWMVALAFFGCLLILIVIGLFFRGRGRNAYSGAVFGAGVACFLQGALLNPSFGTFNGQTIDWASYAGEMWENGAIWLLCIAVPVALAFIPKVRKKVQPVLICIISGALILLEICSLVISGSSSGESEKLENQKNETTPVVTTKGLSEYSSDENVVYLILDSFDETYFEYIQENYPEDLEGLDGFTFFPNMTGSYSNTIQALPYLLSEQPSDRQNTDHNAELASTDFYSDLAANGWTMDVYASPADFGKDGMKYCENAEYVTYHASSDYSLFKKLYKFTSFKYLPLAAKSRVWMYENEFESIKESDSMYPVFDYLDRPMSDYYNYYTENPVTVTEGRGKSYKFIHVIGSHIPYTLDSECVTQESGTNCYDDARGNIYFLNYYIQQLKDAGVYDNTTIIVTADHGSQVTGSVRLPLLLVKPQNTSGEMKVSNAPVCQGDLFATIMEDIGLNEDQKYGQSVFDIHEDSTRDRTFYRRWFEGLWWDGKDSIDFIEMVFPDGSSDPSKIIPATVRSTSEGDVPLSEYSEIDIDKTYTLCSATDPYRYCDYSVRKYLESENVLWLVSQNAQMSFTIDGKIPKEGVTCTIDCGEINEESQRYTIKANGTVVSEGTLTESGQTITFTIPADLIDGGKVILNFGLPDAESPYYDDYAPEYAYESEYAFQVVSISFSGEKAQYGSKK